MLNFHNWRKTPSSAFRKKIQRRPPIFGTFSAEPLVIYMYNKLCFVQLKTLAPSARFSTFKYPVTLKPGLRVTQGHRNYTSRSGTHDFLLTFHSNHRPISHRFRDKRQNPLKIAFSHPTCIKRSDEGSLVSAQGVPNASMMGLPDGWKSFKIDLVVLVQYRLWHPATQPARHGAIASTCYAIASRSKNSKGSRESAPEPLQ